MPTLGAPVLGITVAASFDEGEKFTVGDRRARNPEGLDLNGVEPLFVIENEGEVFAGADHKLATGNFDVARAGCASDWTLWCLSGEVWRRISKCLARVGERFGVHSFVESCQPVEIEFVCREFGRTFDARDTTLQHFIHVAEGGFSAG